MTEVHMNGTRRVASPIPANKYSKACMWSGIPLYMAVKTSNARKNRFAVIA